MIYRCPLCQQTLHTNARGVHCDANHQFDQAKEGYLNLLPVQFKRSKDPGDNKAMTQARRAFLNAGHYAPMRQAMIDALTQALDGEHKAILDVGCGEGYYTHAIADQTADKHWSVHGLDIAKVAVRYAAKWYPQCQFSVASSQRLPFHDNSLDGVVRIYAPCNGEELDRAVKPQGVVVTVTPGPRHLYQLKAGIYQDVRLHETPPETLPNFVLEKEQSLHYTMTLAGEQALTLLQMTPFAWRASDAWRDTLANSDAFECEADFTLRVYRHQGTDSHSEETPKP
ncbi:23S rRNA (guanine(745)-N(1))-methyltransferase [Salinivibrio proteolyticus]|jgi:23S rRNA (guanine745-N1)-methyltransferase|uniref:23S rRNA (guanine(745)-N(1))-methyltransferase n=1 Tax=Salinivibrio TaxID=51366 RepID=UPI000986DCB8|nr:MULTISPECIES: 23S rRNA (guanine(745)-N(1))-methyltransferase [Salinivibrio]OOF21688.1 23S rRNA (guanine(745)-N(1))-methyltransferase [Salinivibrio sp. IB574]OOF22146.1 23S rRNA (guanine(745)-N(1))-methyltransferase [Salinivibrio proteolyticus]OOF26951.1 23S rRNA (guanine(745)-N(1))-methyltransferase [Salinivibrio sp. IB872]OOF32433.1 23S rRNA (guanine(745)-N(1))-methyltransferase [Salinivibrio proteolyticus]